MNNALSCVLFTGLKLTHSMAQNFSWSSDSCKAVQGNLHFVWNAKYYDAYTSWLHDSMQSQMQPIHLLTTYLFKVHFHDILSSTIYRLI